MAKQSVAIEKRLKISKAQQNMLLEVLIASLILGAAIVLSVWLIKYIAFNNKVISEQGETIKSYEKSIINVGICDPGSDNKLSDSELQKCDPNTLDTDNLKNTLRYKVLNELAVNSSLESVARDSVDSCYDGNKKIDYNEEYEKAETDEEKDQALNMISMCSALRVIPDALPGQENIEATMASLNKIFLITGEEPESLAASTKEDTTVDETSSLISSASPNLGVIPMSFTMDSSAGKVQRLLENLEKSIRTFDIQTANFEWNGGTLKMDVKANAYYSSELTNKKLTKTVYSGDKKTTVNAEGSTTGTEVTK